MIDAVRARDGDRRRFTPGSTTMLVALVLTSTLAATAFAADLEKSPTGERAQLSVEETARYGPHLADGDGRALYLLEADPRGESRCYDECAATWPPLLAPEGPPEAEDQAVRDDLIGTITRRDGSTQVTYDGHPLYSYVRDAGRDEITGQDLTDEWGEWYLVTPKGQPLEEHEPKGAS